jgi:hypothetical protein
MKGEIKDMRTLEKKKYISKYEKENNMKHYKNKNVMK